MMQSRRKFLTTSALSFGPFLFFHNLLKANIQYNSPSVYKLKDVNTTDIKGAVELGCQTMSNVFNADDNNIPFFGSEVGQNSRFWFFNNHSESHIPGRHLNALLTAEKSIGYKIGKGVIDKHAQAAFFSYSGAVPLPLNRDKIGGNLNRFLPHNLREGFHALYALVKYRNSEKAAQLAQKSIDVIFKHWQPEKGWNKEYFTNAGVELIEWDGPFITGIARAIGPLVKYYQATGYGKAFELAIILKDKALRDCFTPEGNFDIKRFGTHTHSTTCVMSSLAQLGNLTSDISLIQTVKSFFDKGLKDISDEIGWSIENAGPRANPDRGEVNNTGDILETALILGRWGYTPYYQVAERILRAHLLPSQLRDISFITEPANPEKEDTKRNVAQRHKGAFGFPAPYGHKPLGVHDPSFNMDIVGGAVASLCEAYMCIYEFATSGHRVNLLFDYESDFIKIESPYTQGDLRVKIKKQAPLFIRIPDWVKFSSLSLIGVDQDKNIENGCLFIPTPPLNKFITIKFDLTGQDIILSHRTRKIKARLEGDRIIAMENFGAGLTYFDPL